MTIKAKSPSDLLYENSMALTLEGRFEEALAELDAALVARPNWDEVLYNKGLVLMFMGRMKEAWTFWHHRLGHPRNDPWKRLTDKPMWNGESLGGKVVLLHGEQGLGDTIMFARFASHLARLGAHIIVECQHGLKDVIGTIWGVRQVIERGDQVPSFDVWCPLISIPAIEGMDEDAVKREPYISCSRDKAVAFNAMIRSDKRLRVGIVWSGGVFLQNNHLRSCCLQDFLPLAHDDVQLYSLQMGDARDQIAGCGFNIVDLSPHIRTWADTAAAIQNLDLIVTVDTGVAHLAGAMGKPVWNLIARNLSGHMWMSNRDDTPWYGSMRLFRQSRLGKWDDVMARVAAELPKVEPSPINIVVSFPKTNVTLLTYAHETYWDLAKLTCVNKVRYCVDHDIQFELRRMFVATQQSGERIILMENALRNCQWLFHMGIDTIITNPSFDVRNLCDEAYDLVICNDINGCNNDIFLLKNSERSFAFLREVYELRNIEMNDQDAMVKTANILPRFRTKVIPQRAMNAYPDAYNRDDPEGIWREGDFVMHCPGLPLTKRFEIMQGVLRKMAGK